MNPPNGTATKIIGAISAAAILAAGAAVIAGMVSNGRQDEAIGSLKDGLTRIELKLDAALMRPHNP